MHFDWQTIVSGIVGIGLGVTGISTFFHRWLPLTKRYMSLAAKSISFLDDLAQDLEDDNLSSAEWDALKSKAIGLSAAWKELNAK